MLLVISCGQAQVVSCLLERGVDTDTRSEGTGHTALDIAQRWNIYFIEAEDIVVLTDELLHAHQFINNSG